MHPSTRTGVLLALAAVTWASPIEIFERDNVCPNVAAQPNDWCSGNVDDNALIYATDEKSDWGSINPGDVISSVREHCDAMVCNGISWELDSTWADPKRGVVTPGKVKITIMTQEIDPENFPILLDSLQYTLDRLKDFRVDTIDAGYSCPAGGGCSDGKRVDIEHTNAPTSIRMSIKQRDNPKPLSQRPYIADLAIHVEQSEFGDPLAKGLCAGLTGLGGSVAGAVNPILGVAGSLAGFLCGLGD